MSKAPGWSNNHFRLTAPNSLEAVPVVQAFVRSSAAAMGFSESELTHLELVAEELSTNILQHAYAANEIASFTVECIRQPEQLDIIFRDQGRPFDPEMLPDFSGVDLSTLEPPTGLGHYLAARFVDVFQAQGLGGQGKEIRVTKRLKSTWQPSEEQPGFRQSTPELTQDDFSQVQIRPMKPDEAVEVSRLIYDAYRYTYMSDVPYHPDRLRRLQAEGGLYPFVAVLGNGMVATHTALIHSPEMPTLAEIGLAATRREARGHGLAEKVGMAVFQAATRLGLFGVYANLTTAHTASQKVERRGMGFAVGLLLARSPETVEFKGISDETPQRISTLLIFQTLAARAPVTLHIPAQHHDFIAKTYKHCKIPAQLSTAMTPLLDEPSQVEMTLERERNIAKLSVLAAGQDLLPQVKEQLFGLRLNKVPVVFCFLNMLEPATPTVVAELQQLGFFFTGVLPGGLPEGDALLMTCLLGCAVDYSRIALADPDSQALLEYVQQQDPQYHVPTSAA